LYFGDLIRATDIKLFFTHLDETFETFLPLVEHFAISIVMSIVVVLFIISNHFKKIKLHFLLLVLPLVFFIYNANINDVSLKLLSQVPKTLHQQTHQQQGTIKKPILTKETNQSIILILGESIRAKEYLNNTYSTFESYPYKTIYSGATNTDVSVPLLLNGATHPSHINPEQNLFNLAKENNYATYFISTQNHNYLKYIKPHLGDKIDQYKVLASQDDNDLIQKLSGINFSKKSFVVLQMQGAHSPYTYHEQEKAKTLHENYLYCIEKTNSVLESIFKNYPKHLILFTSDHGENLGENGKFGHNRFTEHVYKVPLIINQNFTHIQSHNDLYKYLLHQIGFKENNTTKSTTIRVYGTMLTGEDGFREFLRKDEL
jgi:glucan phosphoethanolaminetransferase (alkaline phosphatase superfamily)